MIVEVKERWLLKNGKIAIVTHRDGELCAGHIDGTTSMYTWDSGKCTNTAPASYDLRRQLDDEE